jgi:hypothetical protein
MKITIPMPLQIVIEDAGWWSGTDGSSQNQPFRTAMGRRHVPEDYEAIAALGRKLGMRPLAAMVLCEWDQKNILKEIPSATWMGREWDNAENMGPWLERASDIIRRNSRHLEVGLHGVGHEYWGGGKLSRSEFHDDRGIMRPDVARHLDYFGTLMEQNNLGPFPQAFVPPALHHSFGAGKRGIQGLLETFGITYVSTRFKKARAFSPPKYQRLTWECGVLLMERGETQVPWHRISAPPDLSGHGPLLNLHWANLLHADPLRNMEVVDPWVDALKPYQKSYQWMLAPDTPACWTQFAYNELTVITPWENGFQLDIKKIAELPLKALTGHVTLHIKDTNNASWDIRNGTLLSNSRADTFHALKIQPNKNSHTLFIRPKR